MDRLARSLVDMRKLVKDLTARGVAVEFVKEGLHFTGDDSPIAILLYRFWAPLPSSSALSSWSGSVRALPLQKQQGSTKAVGAFSTRCKFTNFADA